MSVPNLEPEPEPAPPHLCSPPCAGVAPSARRPSTHSATTRRRPPRRGWFAVVLILTCVPLAAIPASANPEAAATRAAVTRAAAARAAVVHPTFIWHASRLPAGRFVQRGFDPPAQRWLAGHRGIDVAAFVGEPVSAPAAGVVSFAGDIAGVGIVSILHVNGIRSTYQPITPLVAVGEPVLRGMPIGVVTLGSHCSPPPCLHWGALQGGRYVNPLLAFHIYPRLLPIP